MFLNTCLGSGSLETDILIETQHHIFCYHNTFSIPCLGEKDDQTSQGQGQCWYAVTVFNKLHNQLSATNATVPQGRHWQQGQATGGASLATNATLAITVAQYNKLLMIACISASGLPERLKLWHVYTIKALYNRTLRDLESTS